ncbi:MAG: hypothetical protein H0U54_10715, partial [Acidobacteria bacterium]|nr:hypothetical protein [Acidobacteriota bacterium]
ADLLDFAIELETVDGFYRRAVNRSFIHILNPLYVSTACGSGRVSTLQQNPPATAGGTDIEGIFIYG